MILQKRLWALVDMPSTHVTTFSGEILQRGFWLYVWRVTSPDATELLYVGRTGDNSSPNATAPYTRMGQHLGFSANQNALRKHLLKKGIAPECCSEFSLVSYGPIYKEVLKEEGHSREALMASHLPLRNLVGAMEKALARDLANAGYAVMNEVKWQHGYDDAVWQDVRSSFAVHFPALKQA